jgi:outer membrane protein TolC
MSVGNADLSELGQINLRLERLRDHRGTHHLEQRAASARLAAVIGAPRGTPTPVVDTPPEVALPAAEEEALLAAALDHPRIAAYDHMAAASEERADAEAAAGLPMLSLGADYMDAEAILSIGMTLPIWFGVYSDAADSARAEAAGQRAGRESAEQMTAAELADALAAVADTHRRIVLHERTLMPQAETVLGGTLGSYQTGRGSIADVLLAVRELLDIQLERERILAAHATAWAELEHVVGRTIERRASAAEVTP